MESNCRFRRFKGTEIGYCQGQVDIRIVRQISRGEKAARGREEGASREAPPVKAVGAEPAAEADTWTNE